MTILEISRHSTSMYLYHRVCTGICIGFAACGAGTVLTWYRHLNWSCCGCGWWCCWYTYWAADSSQYGGGMWFRLFRLRGSTHYSAPPSNLNEPHQNIQMIRYFLFLSFLSIFLLAFWRRHSAASTHPKATNNTHATTAQ